MWAQINIGIYVDVTSKTHVHSPICGRSQHCAPVLWFLIPYFLILCCGLHLLPPIVEAHCH